MYKLYNVKLDPCYSSLRAENHVRSGGDDNGLEQMNEEVKACPSHIDTNRELFVTGPISQNGNK